jgi:hypothetical protein
MAKIRQLFITFIITLGVAFVATDEENFVYKAIELMGFENEILKKTILSALITLFIGIFSVFITYIGGLFKTNFKKMNVSVNTKSGGNKRTMIKFNPIDYEYTEENIDIELILEPGGHGSNYLIKTLGISFKFYFNPELLDVYYLNKWETNNDGFFKITERDILINLLDKMKIEGKKFSNQPHVFSEKIVVKPIRVREARTSLDLVVISNKNNKAVRLIAKYLLTVNFDSLKVVCKGA